MIGLPHSSVILRDSQMQTIVRCNECGVTVVERFIDVSALSDLSIGLLSNYSVDDYKTWWAHVQSMHPELVPVEIRFKGGTP